MLGSCRYAEGRDSAFSNPIAAPRRRPAGPLAEARPMAEDAGLGSATHRGPRAGNLSRTSDPGQQKTGAGDKLRLASLALQFSFSPPLGLRLSKVAVLAAEFLGSFDPTLACKLQRHGRVFSRGKTRGRPIQSDGRSTQVPVALPGRQVVDVN